MRVRHGNRTERNARSDPQSMGLFAPAIWVWRRPAQPARDAPPGIDARQGDVCGVGEKAEGARRSRCVRIDADQNRGDREPFPVTTETARTSRAPGAAGVALQAVSDVVYRRADRARFPLPPFVAARLCSNSGKVSAIESFSGRM